VPGASAAAATPHPGSNRPAGAPAPLQLDLREQAAGGVAEAACARAVLRQPLRRLGAPLLSLLGEARAARRARLGCRALHARLRGRLPRDVLRAPRRRGLALGLPLAPQVCGSAQRRLLKAGAPRARCRSRPADVQQVGGRQYRKGLHARLAWLLGGPPRRRHARRAASSPRCPAPPRSSAAAGGTRAGASAAERARVRPGSPKLPGHRAGRLRQSAAAAQGAAHAPSRPAGGTQGSLTRCTWLASNSRVKCSGLRLPPLAMKAS